MYYYRSDYIVRQFESCSFKLKISVHASRINIKNSGKKEKEKKDCQYQEHGKRKNIGCYYGLVPQSNSALAMSLL